MRQLLLLITISWLLLGCATKPINPKAPLISANWPEHQAQIEAAQHWQAVGKLGVKVPNDGGSANLRWQQTLSDYQIDLNGPFGQGKMSITGSPSKVTLTEGGNPPQTAKSAEELIRKNTGWTIPVPQLSYWVRGLPAPSSKITRFAPNAQGLLGELEQLGWTVTYGDYLSVGDQQLALPGRIQAVFNDIRLTLVIREWTLEPAHE